MYILWKSATAKTDVNFVVEIGTGWSGLSVLLISGDQVYNKLHSNTDSSFLTNRTFETKHH